MVVERFDPVNVSIVLKDDGLWFHWNGLNLPFDKWRDDFMPQLKESMGLPEQVMFERVGDSGSGIWKLSNEMCFMYGVKLDHAADAMERLIRSYFEGRRLSIARSDTRTHHERVPF